MPTFENLTDETNISISMKVHTSAMSSVVERKTPHLTCWFMYYKILSPEIQEWGEMFIYIFSKFIPPLR